MEAIKHAATAFFNSFFMESSVHKVITFEEENAFSVPLSEGELIIPLNYHSKLGRHSYSGSFYLKTGDMMERISFEGAVEKLLSSLSSSYNDLFERVFESLENINNILSQRTQEIGKLCVSDPDFIESEQALFAGHAFHPAPKSRVGFTSADAELYSPEARSSFPLRWFFIKEELVFERHSEVFTDLNWLHHLFKSESTQDVPKGFIPYPLHPWQAGRILERADVQEYLKEGKIVEARAIEAAWKPTSSLRSLYRESSPYMLKFSMDVKLTNSVRHMLLHELERGFQVQEMMATDEGQKFLSQNPELHIMYEPAFIALKDKNGHPLKETFVMTRENQFRIKDASHYMLAFMTQDHPASGRSFIQNEIMKYAVSMTGKDIREAARLWMNAFLNHAIKPFLLAQANYGLLLGAHQQNLIVAVKDHLPVGVIFRDCHGIGLSPLGYDTFANKVSSLRPENGNILEKETGNYLFSYYLIINSLFNVISSIGRYNFVSEDMLISETRRFFRSLLDSGVKDPSCLMYLLESKTLRHKGNFFCSVKSINENTTDNPLSIYTDIKNPFFHQDSNL